MFSIFKKSAITQSEPTAYIFIGRSGSGKGTQADLLIKELAKHDTNKILHVETGGLLREFAKKDLYIPKLVKNVLATGGLMPESIAIDTWMNYLVMHFSGVEQVVFDGAPRKVLEAILLDNVLKFFNIPKYKVVYIKTSREWCTDRLSARQRNDDTKSNITKRMDWFDTEVVPCVEFFQKDKDCQVIEINGEQSIEAVHIELMKKVFV